MLTAMIKIQNLMTEARDLANDRRGATAIEYGLIAGLIAVVIIGTVTLVGGDLDAQFQAITDAMNPAAG